MAWDSVDAWIAELDANPQWKQKVLAAVPSSMEMIVSDDSWSAIFEGYLEPYFEAAPRFRFLRAIRIAMDPADLWRNFVDDPRMEVDSSQRTALVEVRDREDSSGNAIPMQLADFAPLRDSMSLWLTNMWLESFQRRVQAVQEVYEDARQEELSPQPLIAGSWLHEDLLRKLKGKPRPTTFAEIEEGGFWWDVFDDWANNCPDGRGWRDKWEQFKKTPSNSKLREELKPLVKTKDAPFNYSVGQLKDALEKAPATSKPSPFGRK